MTNKNYDEHGIFSYDLQKRRHGNKVSTQLCERLIDFLPKNQIVYDMGCGTGEYLEYLQEHGYRVKGFEGTPGMNEQSSVEIQEQDLTVEMNRPTETGVVISLEVAEHIPPKFEKVFIENLIKYTETYLIISWAVPGQGGVGHVNEKHFNNVLGMFADLGFRYQRGLTEKWRKVAGEDLKWLKNSLYVFSRNSNS